MCLHPATPGDDRANASNFRLISILPVPSKVLEKLVHLQLSSHLNSNNLLFPLQSGFRPSHSTQTLLLYCLDLWYKALDKRSFVGVVFLDIAKAFDTVTHNLLLSKLSSLGLSASAVSCFQSYLSNRCHITRLAESYSSPGFPSSGVPQALVPLSSPRLGSSLLSAFVNNPPSILPRDSTVLLADDNTIYIVSDSLPTIQSSLKLCQEFANIWLQRNGLRINAAKTNSMLIHSSRKVVDEDKTVECVQSFKSFGVVVNDTLTWADHIDMVCKDYRSLNLLRRLSWFLPQPLLLLYLKSYILSHFCDVVWIGCTKAESLPFESLLNFVCWTVLQKCKFSSASAACSELGLSSLSSRRKLHLAQTAFKCLYSHCPSYLSQLFPTPSFSYHTQSSSSSQLNLPPARSSYGKRAFSFDGASVWRSLPATTRQIRDF